MFLQFPGPRLVLSLLLALGLLAGCDGGGPEPTEPAPYDGPFRVDRSPSWSPDGTKIAYFRDAGRTEDTTDVSGLYVRDLVADTMWLVVKAPPLVPDWHPDGTRIAFATGRLYTIRPDGSGLQQLGGRGSTFFPSWAPDGRRIAYDRTTPADSFGLWLANPNGSGRKYLHLGRGRQPDWNATGTKLVYTQRSGREIWRADTSGTDSTQLTHNDFIDNRAPAWSPDGEWIAWGGLVEGPRFELWIMRADGSDQQKIVEWGRSPAWGPGSERIVFERPGRESNYLALWIVRRDGTGLRQLTDPSRNPLN